MWASIDASKIYGGTDPVTGRSVEGRAPEHPVCDRMYIGGILTSTRTAKQTGTARVGCDAGKFK